MKKRFTFRSGSLQRRGSGLDPAAAAEAGSALQTEGQWAVALAKQR